MNNFFSYLQTEKGIELYNINLSILFESIKERHAFEKNWESFLESDKDNSEVFFRKGDVLSYFSEILIPDNIKNRIPLLLTFGNPVPHSIKQKCFFSYEGKFREHRIWNILENTGLMSFDKSDFKGDVISQSIIRKNKMYDSDYNSKYVIGFMPFFSMPTTPSLTSYAGVAGIKKLFGNQAFKKIALAERERFYKNIDIFMPQKGVVVVFQKDSYNFSKPNNAPEYDLKDIKQGKYSFFIDEDKPIHYLMHPPTRLIHSTNSKKLLKDINTIL